MSSDALISPSRSTDHVDPALARVLGPQVSDALHRWQEEHRAHVVFSDWLDGGQTPAKVAVVAVNYEDRPPLRMVLKVCPPAPHTAREPERHAQALASGPAAFAEQHLVGQPHAPHRLEDGTSILFQEIAGGSLKGYRPLSALENNSLLPDVAAAIVGSLLEEWNPAPAVERMPARACVTRQLERRAAPDGPLHRWARQVGLSPDDAWIRFSVSGPSLVNPIAWLGGHVAADPELLVLCGHAHGDLHMDNVLLRLTPPIAPSSYRLIDLSTFETSTPLARDPLHLLLATIGRHLTEISAVQRGELAEHLRRLLSRAEPTPGSLRLDGLQRLCAAIVGAGDAWAAGLGMADDWQEQQWLGLVSAALIQCSLWFLPDASRWWFLELAASALTRFLDSRGLADAEAGTGLVVGPLAGSLPAIAEAVERLDELAGGFDGRKTAIAILGGDVERADLLARQPWDLVIDFDPATDSGGAYTSAGAVSGRSQRLVTFGQEAAFGRGSTTWFAAGGLDGLKPIPTDLRRWRAECLPEVAGVFGALARASARPACLCVVGEADARTRMVVETALDILQSRVEIVVVNADGGRDVGAYGVELTVDASLLLDALPERTSGLDVSPREVTVPGQDGSIPLPEAQRVWLDEIGALLHSEVGRAAERVEPISEEFYRGNCITWMELDLGVDLPRRDADAIVARVREDLGNRGTRRISLQHYPGAGGTTLARRVAWELHDQYPTLVVDRVANHAPLVARVRELHTLTDQSVLVVVESSLDGVVERVYSALRAYSTPAVLLIVDRRPTPPDRDGTRTFYLSRMTTAERREFAERFGAAAPERRRALAALAQADGNTAVPFFFGLTAFEESFLGLEGYVARTLEAISEAEADCLRFIAMVHRYAGVPMPAEILARRLGAPADKAVDLRSYLGPDALALLVEEQTGEWRTVHHLVALELLRQLLMPPGGTPASEDWKVKLSTLSRELIQEIEHEFGRYLPDHVMTVLNQLFIVRENQSTLGTERTTFSELLSDVPALEGRAEVMEELATTFPEEAHFWAHLGRMLSYELRDHERALSAVDRAIELSPEDDVLFHMRGMVLRKQAKAAADNPRHLTPAALEREVLDLVEAARKEFRTSNELSDLNEHGHVALMQLCIETITFGKELAGTETFAQFLARPTSGYYRELLGDAEDALDRIREIRGGDNPSRFHAAAEADLQALYDDFAAMLNGWWNLLDREEGAKPLIRRRLVRAYLKRATSWRAAPRADREKAIALLEDNLQDDPRDTGSLLEWIRVGRFEHRSLDRAAEMINYSARAASVVPRDVAFYDYVIAALQALEGRDAAVHEYRRKLARTIDRAGSFGNRRFVYEWYRRDRGLAQLVHHSDLRDWERSAGGPDPVLLSRVEGRVAVIRRPQSGEIEFGPGMRAFFTPAAAGLVAGRNENLRVSFLLGFSYDGPQAWSVKPL